MAKIMKLTSVITILLTISFIIIFYYTTYCTFYTLSITFGTIAYHFTTRLIIGYTYDLILKNKVDYNKKWFKVHKLEMKLYNKIKVKKWKNKMPTYNPKLFDPTIHNWNEIIMAMCQSELVHETIILFSFLPIIGTVWFGSFWVFMITSIISALFDLTFVIIQRFNRTRIIKITSKL